MSYIEKRDCFILELEGRLWKRDPSFSLREITNKGDDPPRVAVSEENKTVDIYLSPDLWGHIVALWELAHECVHCIDPYECDKTSVLEEGLCVSFQMKQMNKLLSKGMPQQTPTPFYKKAWEIVQNYEPEIWDVVKDIRENTHTRIRDIEPEMLCNRIPKMTREDAKILTFIGDYWEDTR